MDFDDPALVLLRDHDMVRTCPTCQDLWIVSDSDRAAWVKGTATACLNCGAQHQLSPPNERKW